MEAGQAWLLYNPEAGPFPAAPLLERAIKIFARAGWDLSLVEGRSAAALRQRAAEAVRERLAAVFVAGGDGTVGLVADELAGSDTALGVLPSGTANVWARELGLPAPSLVTPQAIEQAAEQLASGSVRQVDLGVCDHHSFLLWAGIGLDGKIVNSLGPRQAWSRAFVPIQHAILTLWEAVGWSGIDLGVEALGRRWDGRYIVAVVSNIRAYAGGLLELSPDAKVDDGLLEFWLLKGSTLGDVVGWVIEILAGTHVVDPNVVHFQAAAATFESDHNMPMHLDGEPYEAMSPVQLSVRPRSVKVLVPDGDRPPSFSRLSSRQRGPA